MICTFCGNERGELLLCDGRLEDGRTCNAAMCDGCADHVTTIYYRAGSEGGADTVDCCPTCKRLGRETNWGGMSVAEAQRILDRSRPSRIRQGDFGDYLEF